MNHPPLYQLTLDFSDKDTAAASAQKQQVLAYMQQNGINDFVDSESTECVSGIDVSPLVFYSYDMNHLEKLAEQLRIPFRAGVNLVVEHCGVQDWMQQQAASFEVVRTKHFYLHMSGQAPAAEKGLISLCLNPGVAFGDGQHQTTLLCLELLETLPEVTHGAHNLLDVGTGSGILAIAAAQLGFKPVVATDIEPSAIVATKQHAAAHHVDVMVHLASFPPEPQTFQIVVANIFSKIILPMSEDLVAHVAPGGALLLSGLIDEEQDFIAGHFSRLGMRLTRVLIRDHWLAAEVRKM